MKHDVYGVGNALVDIQARVDDRAVEATGYPKGLTTLVDDETQQRVLTALQSAHLTRSAGGSAANTIMGIADFGGTAAYAAKVGNDEAGRFFLEDMRNVGIRIEVPPAEGATGTCVVLITEDAQRTMLTNVAVSATLGPDDIDENEIRESTYIYVEGYLFYGDTTRAAALRAIELAKANGTKVAFTVSDPQLIDVFRDDFRKLIEGPVDLLFCNEQEARGLTGRDDAIDCAHELHRHTENVALTLGPKGSLLMHEGSLIPIEGAEAKAVDTTGAGDMYAAGVLYGITNGLTWKQAGHLASHAAARIVAQLGARLGRAFTSEEIAELLR